MDRETIKAFHQATHFIRQLELNTRNPEFGRYGDAMDAFFVAVDDQPNIVRCKDCKHGTSYSNGKMFGCITINGLHDADWFCADGEKRE